jgi:hypothetical protein
MAATRSTPQTCAHGNASRMRAANTPAPHPTSRIVTLSKRSPGVRRETAATNVDQKTSQIHDFEKIKIRLFTNLLLVFKF